MNHRWSASEDEDDDWEFVERSRRHSHPRHSTGQCAKCGEENHVTARCRHARRVQCRACGELGHKDRYHTGR